MPQLNRKDCCSIKEIKSGKGKSGPGGGFCKRVIVTVGDSARHCRAMAPCRPPCCRATGPPLSCRKWIWRPRRAACLLSLPAPTAFSPPGTLTLAWVRAPAAAAVVAPRRQLRPPGVKLAPPSSLPRRAGPPRRRNRSGDASVAASVLVPPAPAAAVQPPIRRRPASPRLAVKLFTLLVSSPSSRTSSRSLSPSPCCSHHRATTGRRGHGCRPSAGDHSVPTPPPSGSTRSPLAIKASTRAQFCSNSTES